MKYLKYFLFLSVILISTDNTSAFSSEWEKYGPNDTIIIDNIIIAGNKRTKENIIRYELLFIEGDTLTGKNIVNTFVKTKENLFNTSLFNFITIKTADSETKHSSVYIILEERWYLWPSIIFNHADRNLSSFLHEQEWTRLNYGIMVTKENFRGRKEKLKIKARWGYKRQIQFGYKNPYLSRNKIHGMAMDIAWYWQHETSYKTENNKLLYYHDSANYVLKYFHTTLSYQFRPKYNFRNTFIINYDNINVSNKVIELNQNYLNSNQSKAQFLSLRYIYWSTTKPITINIHKKVIIHF